MVNAQEWLDKKYPKNAKEIEFNGYKLKFDQTNELVFADYPNLERIETTGKINNITKLTITNCPQLVWVNIIGWVGNQELIINNCSSLIELHCYNNKLTNLDLTSCPNLTVLKCWDNKLTKLDLSDCNNLKLTKLSCYNNKLTNLDLTSCPNLTVLYCSNNQLTKLDLSDCSSLTKLKCSNNQLTNLDLTSCPNLTELYCFNNKLTNLKFIQPLTKLEEIYINGNNIISGLEYLPLSLKKFHCEGKIWKELASYGKNLMVWQQKDNLSLASLSLTNKITESTIPLTVVATPKYLLDKIKATELANIQELPTNFTYTNFALEDTTNPLIWTSATTKLPLRLYNLTTEQVETTNKRNDIPNYAILSYVWGGRENDKVIPNQDYEISLTKLGQKAVTKVNKTLEYLNTKQAANLHYLWIDQFCINQTDKKEKGQEVAKQKNYYNNAITTLIAINNSIGKKNERDDFEWSEHIMEQIVTSSWFTRSWTFQEGLLSKQTIFMFDDGLVDGRVLATIWAGIQDSHVLNQTTIFSTPLGWSVGAKQEHSINLSLTQALDAVRNRRQTVALDSIYSILGLLPYGEKTTPNYQSDGHNYTKEELEQPLQELMALAIEANPYEVISWWGERRNEPKLWQIPEVNGTNLDGTTNIKGSMNLTVTSSEACQITEQGIFLIGMNRDNEDDNRYIEILPNSKQIASDKWFAILVPKSRYNNLPIKIESSDYSATADYEIFIDMVKKEVFQGEEATTQYQVCMEIPTKK